MRYFGEDQRRTKFEDFFSIWSTFAHSISDTRTDLKKRSEEELQKRIREEELQKKIREEELQKKIRDEEHQKKLREDLNFLKARPKSMEIQSKENISSNHNGKLFEGTVKNFVRNRTDSNSILHHFFMHVLRL